MSVRNRVVASALAGVVCLGAYTGSAGAAVAPDPSVVSRGVAVPDFYNPPAELPAADGALIRSEPLPLGLSLPGLGGPLPGRATRLMYKSTDSNGKPVAVTGAYIEPSAAWKGGGPRPLVAVASGTMGQGDQCAPSLALQHPLTANGSTLSVGYEDVSVYRLLAAGTAVVVTDYVGFGTTDRLHTYVDRVDEAHAVLDSARVAHAVPGASISKDSRVGLFGYSQGGGASAAAAELQPAYAPDVKIAGTYSGAPPADLVEVMKGIDGSALVGALAWALNGFIQTDPDLKPFADTSINAAGKAAMADLSTMCLPDAVFKYGFKQSTSWTTSGKPISEVISGEPGLTAFLGEQRIGRLKPSGPVRVATGVKDDIVVHAQSRRLAVDWCAKGADVTYVPVRLPNLGDRTLLNHLSPLVADQSDAISWLTDRLNGKPATGNCATLPRLP